MVETSTKEEVEELKEQLKQYEGIYQDWEILSDKVECLKDTLREILDLAENWDIRPGYRKLETKQDLIDVIRKEIL